MDSALFAAHAPSPRALPLLTARPAPQPPPPSTQADTACYARPQYKHASLDVLRNTLQPFLHALRAAGRHPSQGFWSVPSPGTLAVFCEDRVFGGDHTAYVMALARVRRPPRPAPRRPAPPRPAATQPLLASP